MHIDIYPPLWSRGCRFCLSLQDDSVFADFDVDLDGRVFVVRISFDGYGCCDAPIDVGRMGPAESAALLSMIQDGTVRPPAEAILRAYFQANRDALWANALADHALL